MADGVCWREIPTELNLERFEEFILPHLTLGSRGPLPKLPLHTLFNYILKLLYLGCQWKELPIEKDATGRREIHHTRIWRTFRRWVADGCFNAIFEGTVLTLHQAELLDISIIHGDGTTTAAKKGGDNIGFNGHKKIKGDKVVAFCDRNCNVIAPFVSAPGNQNESPLLREALPRVTRIASSAGLDLRGTIVSLDGVYDCPRNRKAIFNRGMESWPRLSEQFPANDKWIPAGFVAECRDRRVVGRALARPETRRSRRRKNSCRHRHGW